MQRSPTGRAAGSGAGGVPGPRRAERAALIPLEGYSATHALQLVVFNVCDAL
jgi:hypothetical protein